jgi:hypothetical protein
MPSALEFVYVRKRPFSSNSASITGITYAVYRRMPPRNDADFPELAKMAHNHSGLQLI